MSAATAIGQTIQTSPVQMIKTRGGRVNADGYTIGQLKIKLGYAPHGDGGPDRRGSNRDRHERALKIIGAKPILRGPARGKTWGGNGKTVPCVHCGELLTLATLTQDRIDPFGPYTLINIQAACGRCNTARGDDITWRYDPKIHMWGPRAEHPQAW